jgi:CO dehydrogenase/acetyl-CoA synthase beta subunit
MGLFDKQYHAILDYLDSQQNQEKVSVFSHSGKPDWPVEKKQNLVLGQDTAVELGNPKDASSSFLLWVNQPGRIKNGRITIVGPDLPQLIGKQVSFGKIVIIEGSDFDEENSYERYREMELLRYDIHLKGYMMRGVSQQQREWSRVSKEAISNGFSFKYLGGALIDQFSQIGYVRAVETVFITSGREDVQMIKAISDNVYRVISAMNKMADEMSFDCATCDYTDLCADVAELRSMRKKLQKKGEKIDG